MQSEQSRGSHVPDRRRNQLLTLKKRRSSQAQVLNGLGITHKVRPDGSLVVLRSRVEQQFGFRAPSAKQEIAYEPNRGALAEFDAEVAEKKRAQQEAKKQRIEKANREREKKGLPPLPFD